MSTTRADYETAVRRQVNGSRAESRPRPAVLRSCRMRVDVPRIRMHDPALRASAAHDAPEKHCASIARHRVVMPRHVTVDPAPHKSPSSAPMRRREASAMPCARAVALQENVRRFECRGHLLQVKTHDGTVELAGGITVSKCSFTTECWHSPDGRNSHCLPFAARCSKRGATTS